MNMQNKKLVYNRFNPDPFHTHQKLLNKITPGSKVLEIGSATGYITEELVKKGCKVTSVEIDKDAAKISQKTNKINVLVGDVLNIDKLINKNKKFDYVLLADVLEHTLKPKDVLLKLKNYLNKEGRILISVPNIANFSIRLMILRGKFEYKEWGIMDKTHYYFFTISSIEKIFRELNLEIIDFDVVSGFETSAVYRKTIGPIVFRVNLLRRFEYFITKLIPGLFSLELIYVLKKK